MVGKHAMQACSLGESGESLVPALDEVTAGFDDLDQAPDGLHLRSDGIV